MPHDLMHEGNAREPSDTSRSDAGAQHGASAVPEIVAEEESILGRVLAEAARARGSLRGPTDYDSELVSLRDQIAEARLEDVPPLVEQMERLQSLASRRAAVEAEVIDRRSPYFGHLRLREGGKTRDVLIGRATYLDSARNVRIVDWRDAPISRLYYRYEEGDDYEEEFGGRVRSGEVLARRSVAIHDAALRRVGCLQGTFVRDDDGSWRVLHSEAPRLVGGQGIASRPEQTASVRGKLGIGRDGQRRVDKTLPEIAALIDPRQFDLITRPDSGLVVIHGGAGSGKTTVGLHRVAYLSFQAPNRFAPDKMMVVVFNAALASYISRVLPALGVEGVPVRVYADWAAALRRAHVPGLPTEYSDDTPAAVVRLKKHPALLLVLERWVGNEAIRFERELDDALGKAAGGDLVRRAWRAANGLPLEMRARMVAAWAAGEKDVDRMPAETPPASLRTVVERIVARVRARTKDVRGAWSEVLTDRAALMEGFAQHATDVRREEVDTLVHWCSSRLTDRAHALELGQLRAEAASERDARHGDEEDDADSPDEDSFVGADGLGIDADADVGLDREDDAILLRLYQLLRGPLFQIGSVKPGAKRSAAMPLRYEHLFIDEAQDLSPIDLKVLVETTTARRSITLAGDTAQRLMLDNGFSDWRTVLDELGIGHVAIEPLRLSYRSTHQILDVARHVLGPLADPEPPIAMRSGADVELHRFPEAGAAVAFLAEALRDLARAEPRASIALIARYPSQAALYHQGLSQAEVPNLRLVRDQDFSFRPGVDVTDVRQVKGLEFDYVVLLEAAGSSYPEDDESRHLLHIAMTRAMHQLWITCTGEPSRLFPEHLRSW
ncbi:MAG: ATP-binding domain-containing protein [Deltaproteobacteria bacterium]|nr:ATP-binding domain-containing protein [Deltaproteobacteria bacterium]